jgi:hypothetical protein
MTRKSVRSQHKRRSDRRRDIYLPHSSWSRASAVPANAAIAPDDFWARLGL